MSPEASAAIIKWFVDYFSPSKSAPESTGAPLGAVVYEMFGLNDSFGKVMQANLKVTSVPVPLIMGLLNEIKYI